MDRCFSWTVNDLFTVAPPNQERTMLRHKLSGLLLAGIATGTAAAQVPPACTCTQTVNISSATDPDIGQATIAASCQVIFPSPGSSSCQVSGTITFYYCPSSGFGWGYGEWGPPTTVISNPDPTKSGIHCPSTNNPLTYTLSGPGDTAVCGQGSVASHLYVTGTSGSGTAYLNPRVVWRCDTL